MAYFPVFADLEGKDCLIVGGGYVALRKAKDLVDFGACVVVIAEEVLEDLTHLEGVTILRGSFREDLLDERYYELVVAATDDPEVNRAVGLSCRKRRIPVNVVDDPGKGSFIFPAYLKAKDVVAAFSGGGSPVLARYMKEESRSLVTERLGEIGELLAGCRPYVRSLGLGAEEKKALYEKILEAALKARELPTEEEREEFIKRLL